MADEMSINLWDDKHMYTQAVGWHRSTLLYVFFVHILIVLMFYIVHPGQSLKYHLHPRHQYTLHLRAYQHWHYQNMSLEKMCMALSLKSRGYGPQIPGDDKNLRPSTVM